MKIPYVLNRSLLTYTTFYTQTQLRVNTTFQSSRTVILCFVTDIGTILAKLHSCLLIDIGLIAMIFEISLNESSGFVGARLFKH